MIITRLELDDFAGLKDFRLDLTEGINVFYGENGTGKTTLGLFIRTMLYGVGNDRKRDGVTMRMHIIPIGVHKASGRMTVEVAGRRLEIARSFGQTKRTDRISMTWLDDGSRLEISNEPGEYFLDLNEETFSRTFFVGEMNHAVLPGTTGELTSRLMNLSITGHENMDYHQAVKKLKDEARSITNQRGSGSLDELIRQKLVIAENIDKAKYLTSDLAMLHHQLELDQDKKTELTLELDTLKQKSDSLDQLKELEDYERAMLLLAKKADLEERIQKIKVPLDLAEISQLKGQLEQFLAQEARVGQMVDRHNEEAGDLAELEAGFSSEYDRLFHPSNERIVREYLSEKETLDADIGLLKNLTPQKITALQSGLDLLKNNRRKINFLSSPWIWVIPAALFILSGSFGLAAANYGMIMAGAAVSLILAYSLLKAKKSWLASLLNQDQTVRDSIMDLWEETTGMRFLAILDADPDFSPMDALQRWETQYQALVGKVNSLGLEFADLGDYLKEQVGYSAQKGDWQHRLTQLEKNHGILEEEAEQLAIERDNLTEQLSSMGLSCDKAAVSGLEHKINQLQIQAVEEGELERTLAELTQLSVDRNLNPILLEPQKHREEGVRRELDIQRQLLRETDRVKADIASLDIQMTKEEAQIQNLAVLLGAVTQQTGSLEKVEAEIERSSRRHRVLELALENLEGSYREIQRDYLPRVSQKVSETFKELTGGRFDHVLLSGDYRMKVPLAGELSSMEYLSRGNLDLLWLGLRLSLCDIIIRGEKAPLIFDDSFLHLDEERLKNVLRYLSERIDGQIIILTCHHRETRLMNEMDLL